MPTKEFEVDFAVPLSITGGINQVRLQEQKKGGTGAWVDAKVIRRKDYKVRVLATWGLRGSTLSSPYFKLDGKWVVQANFEGIGPNYSYEQKEYGPTEEFAKLMVPVTNTTQTPPPADAMDWEATIDLPDDVNDPIWQQFLRPGPYRLVVSVIHEPSAGQPGEIAGFYDFGMLQIY